MYGCIAAWMQPWRHMHCMVILLPCPHYGQLTLGVNFSQVDDLICQTVLNSVGLHIIMLSQPGPQAHSKASL